MVVLCIDDDPEDIQIFCDALKEINEAIKCIAAYNGQQAIDILSSGLVPNYIFLDINMPLMSGMDILKKIRALRHMKSAPIFMYSTTMNPNEIDNFKRNGATEFVIKPAKFQDLCNVLKSLIK